MENMLTREDFGKWMKTDGKVRGLALISHKGFVMKEKGREGLMRLEFFLEGIGYPQEYREISPMEFYPVGLEIIELLAIKSLFNFEDEKFREIGVFSSKMSLILRTFMKYFVSLETALKQAPLIWRKYYTIGELTVREYNKEKNHIIIRVSGLKLHPLHCLHLEGYICSVIRMIVKKPTSCRETVCGYKTGGEFHEFVIKW